MSCVISSFFTDFCFPGVLAFATSCAVDEYLRPSAGLINICLQVCMYVAHGKYLLFEHVVLLVHMIDYVGMRLYCYPQNLINHLPVVRGAPEILFNLIAHEMSHAFGFSSKLFPKLVN